MLKPKMPDPVQHRGRKRLTSRKAEAPNDSVEELHEGEKRLLEPETLDEFLGEMFGQTKTGDEGGMPTLGWLKEHFKTKSAAIRHLHEKGFSVNQIRKHLDLRYQHVRNVLKTQLKRGPNEDFHLAEGQAVEAFRNKENEEDEDGDGTVSE